MESNDKKFQESVMEDILELQDYPDHPMWDHLLLRNAFWAKSYRANALDGGREKLICVSVN